MKIQFGKDFLWGGASAAEQCEGHGKTKKAWTVWDQLFKEKPEMFYKGIGPNITNDFTRNYKEDIKKFKEIGSNSVRLGFSWARIMPDGKNVSKKGVDFYHSLLKELKENKIKAIMTLFHFDMPFWAQEKGGFENFDIVDAFADYARFIFKEFGDEVYMYATMNEPIVPIINGYLGGHHYPGIFDPKRAVQFGYGTIMAHVKAVNIFNEEFKDLKAKIGVVINIAPAYAKDGKNYTSEDKKAADDFNVIHNYSMLDPMIKGRFPKKLIEILSSEKILPKIRTSDKKELAKVRIDFVGMNFYAPTRFQAPDGKGNIIEKIAKPFKWDKARMNVFRGWEIYPQAIYDASKMLKERYDNIPFYISENGMGVQNEEKYRDPSNGEINDDYRIAFIQEHLEQIHRANTEGANCFGYHMWAIFDCWSWANAYKNTYGFIEVNLKNQERKIKKSGRWFSELTKTNEFDSNYKKVDEVIDLKNAEREKSLNWE